MSTDLVIPSIEQITTVLFDVEENDDSIADMQARVLSTMKMLEEELADEEDAGERAEINRLLTGLKQHLQELNALGVKTFLTRSLVTTTLKDRILYDPIIKALS